MEKNSVSMHFVRSAVQSLVKQNIDNQEINKIMQHCKIDYSLLQDDSHRVTAEQFSQLWLSVAQCLNDEFFGQDSHQMKVGSFVMLCRMAVNYHSLKSALIAMLRFFNLLLDDFYSELITEGQYSRIQITQRDQHTGVLASDLQSSPQPARIFGHETLLILQHGIICWLVGRRIPIFQAGFAYAKPTYSVEYQLMYSAELQFDQPYTSLTFDSRYLQLPVVQNEQTLRGFIQQAPTNIVLKYKNYSSYSATIRKSMREMTVDLWPDFDTFASQLNMTRSTLRRRLSEEGQPFQAIKDQLRRDIAMTLLRQPEKSVTDISSELGFAEPSAFHRAFKKWTNQTPNEYRQGLRK